MDSLFDPAHRRGENIKWGLVSYTVIVFLLATAFTAMSLGSQIPVFSAWIEHELARHPIPPIHDIMLLLNYWLADALLVGV